jgi:uracil DNA glycosylase
VQQTKTYKIEWTDSEQLRIEWTDSEQLRIEVMKYKYPTPWVLNSGIYNSFEIKQVNYSYDKNCNLPIDWSKWIYSN